MKNKALTILFIVIGSVAILLSIRCFVRYTGQYSDYITYGGEAYTGIQNAGAETANNVKATNEILSFGFGSVLLVIGATMLGVGIISYQNLSSPTPNSGSKVDQASDNDATEKAISPDQGQAETSESDNLS